MDNDANVDVSIDVNVNVSVGVDEWVMPTTSTPTCICGRNTPVYC